MAQVLKADTQVVVMLGPAVDKTDGVTLESGLVTAMDTTTTGIRISKNGGAWADRAATVVTTVYDEGWYQVTLKTGDVDTEGTLDVMYEDATTVLPLLARFQVVNANVYDSLYAAAATDVLDVNVTQWLGTAAATPTTAGVPEVDVTFVGGQAASATGAVDFDDVATIEGLASGATGFAAINTDVELILADTGTDGVVIAAAQTVATVTTLTGHTPQTGDTFALANGATGFAAINTDVELILADTGTDGVLVSDGTGAGQIALTAGAVDTVTSVTNQVSADMTAISGDTTAADRLEGLMDGTLICQVNDASATTTAFAADGFTEATDDHFNGRLITFISGALTGQQTDITDYDAAGGAQGSQQFTVTALTEAPANNDFFVIH